MLVNKKDLNLLKAFRFKNVLHWKKQKNQRIVKFVKLIPLLRSPFVNKNSFEKFFIINKVRISTMPIISSYLLKTYYNQTNTTYFLPTFFYNTRNKLKSKSY